MKYRLTRSILPTAVLFLLSALTLPGTPHSFSAKNIYIDEPVLSADILPSDGVGKPGGDDQEYSLASSEPITRLTPPFTSFNSIPAPAPDFAHTVSQARAPPLS